MKKYIGFFLVAFFLMLSALGCGNGKEAGEYRI